MRFFTLYHIFHSWWHLSLFTSFTLDDIFHFWWHLSLFDDIFTSSHISLLMTSFSLYYIFHSWWHLSLLMTSFTLDDILDSWWHFSLLTSFTTYNFTHNSRRHLYQYLPNWLNETILTIRKISWFRRKARNKSNNQRLDYDQVGNRNRVAHFAMQLASLKLTIAPWMAIFITIFSYTLLNRVVLDICHSNFCTCLLKQWIFGYWANFMFIVSFFNC